MNCQKVTTQCLAAILAAATLSLIMTAVPASAQNAVPPTAREAAASPEFASRLTHRGVKPSVPTPRGASPQSTVLYNNGMCDETKGGCSSDAWTINFGYVVADSFTLSSAATVKGFDFVVWAVPGDTLKSVDWSITSTAFGGTVYGSGTATATLTKDQGWNQYGYEIQNYSASFTGLNLAVGTYYLNLQNAVTSAVNPIYWDENSGPSQAYESALGSIPSESFDVTGENGAGGCFESNQHLQVLHSFTAQEGKPWGLTEGKGGFYGITSSGGDNGLGLAYKITGDAFTPLYSFTGGANGYSPYTVIVDQDGSLYGYASGGIKNCGTDGSAYCGLIFRLRPSPLACRTSLCSWSEEVLYRATGNNDNDPMPRGGLVLDQAGNLYGTCGYGVCELTPSDGGWKDKLLYSDTEGIFAFLVGNDGSLYGTNPYGGDLGLGAVFQLAPSGSGWTKNIIYSFLGHGNGQNPEQLFQDIYGNLYGRYNIDHHSDGIFMLSPSDGKWVFSAVWQTQSGEGFRNVGMDIERHFSPGGIVVGGGCSGQDCSASTKPDSSVYYYGYFDRHLLNGLGGQTDFMASSLIIGGGGQTMWGTTSNCGSYNNGTFWYWHIW